MLFRSVVAVILAIIIAIILYRNARIQAELLAEQESEVQAVEVYNQYIDYLNQLYVHALDGAGDAESVCVLTYNVWSDRIYKDYTDSETSEYTIGTSDFNEAVQNVYADEEIKKKLSSIKRNQDTSKEIIQKLQSCPTELSNAYNSALDTYTAFNSLAELALSPTGNLGSYQDSEQSRVETYMNAAATLIAVIPSKKSIPYFDEETENIATEFEFANCLNQQISNLTCIQVEGGNLLGVGYYNGETEISGITGDVSMMTHAGTDIVEYIAWKTDSKVDKETVNEIIHRLTLIYGDEYQNAESEDNQHVWSNGNYYISEKDMDNSLEITWIYGSIPWIV